MGVGGGVEGYGAVLLCQVEDVRGVGGHDGFESHVQCELDGEDDEWGVIYEAQVFERDAL
jgi:hypothetical protein